MLIKIKGVYVFNRVKFILFLLWCVWIELIDVGIMVVKDVVVVMIMVFFGDMLSVWNRKNNMGIIIILLFIFSIFVSRLVKMLVLINDKMIVKLLSINCM